MPSHRFLSPRVAVSALLAALALLALGGVCLPAAVAAAPPVAKFHRTPAGSVLLLTGQPATFTSDSTPGSSLSWKIDGVPFGSARSITHTFTEPGFHVVTLKAVLNGQSDVAESIFGVNSALYPVPLQPPVKPAPSLMNPFPTVRLSGLVGRRGARITLLEVTGAPRNARVTVRCSGKGCPFRVRRLAAPKGRVRLSKFPRVLRAKARLRIFVRAPDVIGKYTAFRIRAGKAPVRTDRCLKPGSSTRPSRCT